MRERERRETVRGVVWRRCATINWKREQLHWYHLISEGGSSRQTDTEPLHQMRGLSFTNTKSMIGFHAVLEFVQTDLCLRFNWAQMKDNVKNRNMAVCVLRVHESPSVVIKVSLGQGA